MGRNHPLPKTGVTVINAVPFASGWPRCVARWRGSNPLEFWPTIQENEYAPVLPSGLRTPGGVNSAPPLKRGPTVTLFRRTAGKALNATPRRHVKSATRRPTVTFRLPFDTRGTAAKRQSPTTQARGTSTYQTESTSPFGADFLTRLYFLGFGLAVCSARFQRHQVGAAHAYPHCKRRSPTASE